MPDEFIKHFLDIDWSKVKNVELVSKEETDNLSAWIDEKLNTEGNSGE